MRARGIFVLDIRPIVCNPTPIGERDTDAAVTSRSPGIAYPKSRASGCGISLGALPGLLASR